MGVIAANSRFNLFERERAIREYQHVAGRYAADGFLLKAMAICKVILNLDPQHTETQSTLAKLYATHRGESIETVLPASMSGALRTRLRLSTTQAIRTASSVVDRVYELAGSDVFASCQVKKAFKLACLRDPVDSNDRQKIDEWSAVFKTTGGYRMKPVFAEAAAYCMGN